MIWNLRPPVAVPSHEHLHMTAANPPAFDLAIAAFDGARDVALAVIVLRENRPITADLRQIEC
jgi:hypothetical protein